MGRLLIWVQHLWGIGHTARIAAIAKACAGTGIEVTILHGGMGGGDLYGHDVRIQELPPIRSRDSQITSLVTETGHEIDDEHWADRQRRMQHTLRDVRPDVILTELFPFGRRAFARELLPFLDEARTLVPRPRVLASVRDILTPPSRPAQWQKSKEIFATHYDQALVHGDEAIAPLSLTCPFAPAIAEKTTYTGYVVTGAKEERSVHGEIVVSGGGGASAFPLCAAAMETAKRDKSGAPWRIIAGPAMPEEEWIRLLAKAGPAILTREMPGLAHWLSGARASIGRAGYNTAVEGWSARVPLILVPFVTGKETEQRLRAEILASKGQALHVPEETLTPDALLDALARARPPAALPVRFDGAAGTARFVANLAPWRRA